MHFKFFSCKKTTKDAFCVDDSEVLFFHIIHDVFRKTTPEFIPQKIHFLEDYLGKTWDGSRLIPTAGTSRRFPTGGTG